MKCSQLIQRLLLLSVTAAGLGITPTVVRAEAVEWESLGEALPEAFSLEAPGSFFNPEAFDTRTRLVTSDELGNDFTTLEMRSFPELGITVPESGPGAEAFYRAMSILTGKGRANAQDIFQAAQSPFTTPDGKITTRLDFIREELSRAGLPPLLAWIVAQESGFRDQAKSSAGAWGAWQFIIRTADRFDLDIRSTTVSVRSRGKRKRTITVQECTGCKVLPHATRAASEYLSEMFEGAAPEKYYQWKNWKNGMPLIRWSKDWALTMAAYNTGEHNVAKAICNPVRGKVSDPAQVCLSGTEQKDFWSIYPRLHPQTQHYVPVILAWMRVGQELKRFGF